MKIPTNLPFIAPRMRIIKDAAKQRRIINQLATIAELRGFTEIGLPTIEPRSNYTNKIGPEMTGQMFSLEDTSLVLRPEGTATLQLLASGPWKSTKDIKVFYAARCFRYERPQKGRYREFTQFGCEWLNPRKPSQAMEYMADMADHMAVEILGATYEFIADTERGLTYYTDRKGFEIRVPSLGAIQQVCGGGAYAEGVGFAFGVDRLSMAKE